MSQLVISAESITSIRQETKDLVLGYLKFNFAIKEVADLILSWCALYCKTCRSLSPTEYRVPRSFKLLNELHRLEIGAGVEDFGLDFNFVGIGVTGWDHSLTHWNASIIPIPGGYVGDRIYCLAIEVGDEYPDEPPKIRFVQKVDMKCVDEKGYVLFDEMKEFEWNYSKCLGDAIVALREEMNPNEVSLACSKIPNGQTYD